MSSTRILGRYQHWSAAGLDEIAVAVGALTDRHVVLNAHRYPAPAGSVVYNLEDPRLVPDPLKLWPGHEIWEHYSRPGTVHVPVGYHPSMERFTPHSEPDLDVVFAGIVTQRRADVLNGLIARGLRVVALPVPCFGQARDSVLARARLVLDVRSYEDGSFGGIRAAHLLANKIPMLTEGGPDCWPFLVPVKYEDMVDTAFELLERTPHGYLPFHAARLYEEFRKMPMVLPS